MAATLAGKSKPTWDLSSSRLPIMIVWQEQPDPEKRLEELRNRDLELAKIALGLQMRSRITNLENENASLRAMQSAWTMSRVSRLYFTIPIIGSKIASIPRRLVSIIRRTPR